MIIQNFTPFNGQHCETTATGTLLKQIQIDLSEPLLFGIGEGLGYVFWKMKTMDFPFIGGRVKTDKLTENLCRNLNLKLQIKETSSIKKAWKNVSELIDQGKAVGLKLDCYHLDYFTSKIHFAGHYAAMYGYDAENAYLVDTNQQGGLVKTSLKNLELARNEKGPMSSKNLSYTIERSDEKINIKKAIQFAIHNNALEYLNPPIANLCYKGIIKTSKEIIKWFNNSKNIKSEFQTSAMLMERAGTGGALFRNLYRDFLQESAEILESKELEKEALAFKQIAKQWTTISELFYLTGETQKVKHLETAAKLLVEISEMERVTMQSLLKLKIE